MNLGGANLQFNVGPGTAAEQIVISAPVTNGRVTKSGPGVLELSGADTYMGGTTVSAGTLLIGANGALPDSTVSITRGTLRSVPVQAWLR